MTKRISKPTNRSARLFASSLVLTYLVAVSGVWWAACASKVNTDPGAQTITRVKRVGAALSALLDEAITLEKQFADAGQIDPQFEPQLRAQLQTAKAGLDAFNARAAGYTTFDANSKADVLKLVDDSVTLLNELNNAGVLHIKNAEAQQRAQLILGAAAVTVKSLRAFLGEP